MRSIDFNKQLTEFYLKTQGGKSLLPAGHTAVHQVAVIGQIEGPGDRPFLYVVRAPLSEETQPGENLQVNRFDTKTAQVQWHKYTRKRPPRVTLHLPKAALRLALPTEDAQSDMPALVDGAPLTPVNDMIPGEKPLQRMPPSLESLTRLLIVGLIKPNPASAA